MAVAVLPGWYGKLPALGDFASRRLPPVFVEPWDRWLATGLSAWRDADPGWLEAYLGAPDPYDSVLIEGSPRIYSRIAGGVHGDIATASITVNSIPAVLTAPPGLRTMRDMRLPSFFSGT